MTFDIDINGSAAVSLNGVPGRTASSWRPSHESPRSLGSYSLSLCLMATRVSRKTVLLPAAPSNALSSSTAYCPGRDTAAHGPGALDGVTHAHGDMPSSHRSRQSSACRRAGG